MSMTYLQIIQQAVGEMGSGAVPSSIAGNQNQDTIQQSYLLNGLGQALMRDYQWQDANEQYIFTVQYSSVTGSVVQNSTTMTVATAGLSNLYGLSGPGINQATYVSSITDSGHLELSQPATSTTSGTYAFSQVKYPMPSDFDRIIDRTQWDKTKHWELLGPETAQQWEWLISGYVSTGPRIRWRIFNNYFQIWPLTSSSEVLGFEYVSNGWAFSASGTRKQAMTVDSDTCMFPDRLMVDGLKSAYYEAKGFPNVFKEHYDRQLSIATANDSGSQTLSMAPRVAGILITGANLPDTGYGH